MLWKLTSIVQVCMLCCSVSNLAVVHEMQYADMRTCPLRQLLNFNAASSLCKSTKPRLNLVSKGIKLSLVSIQHSSHNKAPQWQKRVRIVKRMLASVSADATTGILHAT